MKREWWEVRTITEGRLIAKGDLQFVTDKLQGIPNAVIGKTHFIIPASGYFQHLIRADSHNG